jgi:hypothetical protein
MTNLHQINWAGLAFVIFVAVFWSAVAWWLIRKSN